MRLAAAVILAFVAASIVAAPPVHAQFGVGRAVQVSPDGANLLITKPFNGQMWSIVVNFDAQTVAGDVFNFDGSDPQFLYCDIVEHPITSPADFTNLTSVVLDCRGGEGCGTFPCSPADWTELGQVSVVVSFFVPPGTPLHCNQVGPPECAGTCGASGAQCISIGDGCACTGDPTPTPTPPHPTSTPVPQPTFTSSGQPFCCRHCTTGIPCGDSCISASDTCHQPPGCACF
jgi:hypothetical protein